MADPRTMAQVLENPYFAELFKEPEQTNSLIRGNWGEWELDPTLFEGISEIDLSSPITIEDYGDINSAFDADNLIDMAGGYNPSYIDDFNWTFDESLTMPIDWGDENRLDAALEAAAKTPGGSWENIELSPEELSWASGISAEEAARRAAFLDPSIGSMEALRKVEYLDGILHAADPSGVNKWTIGENGTLSPLSEVSNPVTPGDVQMAFDPGNFINVDYEELSSKLNPGLLQSNKMDLDNIDSLFSVDGIDTEFDAENFINIDADLNEIVNDPFNPGRLNR